DFLVGYTGADNVQIDPADLLSDYSQGTGAAGQVTFFSATSTVTGDNNFYWDNTNKRLGIGTTTPETKAHIKMSGGSAQLTLERTGGGAGKVVLAGAAEGLIVYNDSFASKMYVGTSGSYDGKVGIGTITPASTLDVNGTLIATGISQLGSGGANVYLTSSSAGSVGIGTSSPAKKLHVKGSAPWIRIEEDSASNKRLDLYVNPSTAIGVIAANQSAQQLSFQTSNTDRLRITNAGNVGIGTTSPSTKLEVNGTVHLGSGGNDVTIGASNSSVIFMIRAGYNYIQASDASGAIMFRTGGGNNRMIIDSSGNVGIGTTSPAQKLDVFGAIRVNSDGDRKIDFLRTNGNHFSIEHDTSQIYFYNHTTSEIPILMQNDGDVIMNAGNVGIGTASPTSKLTVAGEITASAANATLNLLSETNGNSTINFADPADNNVGQIIYRHNGNSMSFDTNDLERMRIDSSGNVGIGTTSPGAKLTVSDSTDNAAELRVLRANSSSSTYASVGTVGGTGLFKSSGDVRLQATGAANLSLNTNGSDRIRIDSAGNVGIGTTNIGTNDKLLIKTSVDNSVAQGLVIQRSANTDEGYINYNGGGFQFRSTDGDPIVFGQVSNERMRIDSSGNVGIGTSSPQGDLHVVGKTGTAGRIYLSDKDEGTSGTDSLLAMKLDTDAYYYNRDTGKLFLGTNNDSTHLTIDSSGNVGIGTTSPGAKLEVKGATAENTQIRIQTDGGASEVPTLLLRRSS
ncbi:MAG: autotransporter outer membrane beta-barrel domain-containing protein, partial [Planctomycetota bacterium]